MSDLSPDLEKLTLAGRGASSPNNADFERVLGALQGRLGAGVVGSAMVSTTGSIISGKAIAITVAGLALVLGGVTLYSLGSPAVERSSSPAGPVANVVAAEESAISPRASAPNVESQVPAPQPSGLLASQVKNGPATAGAREPNRAHDSLSEEVAILTRAETELHSGRAENALKLLNEHERKFAHGILAEERTAARIQALCALGRGTEANAQLARLRPGSLHGEPSRQACASNATKNANPTTGQSAPGLPTSRP